MLEQLHEKTIKADKFTAKRIGSIELCLALGACDIGEAKVDGKKVYITWGRSLDRAGQQWAIDHTGFQPVWTGADDGSAELVLSSEQVKPLLSLLV